MTFQPVGPFAGPAGWAVLHPMRETQQDAFETSSCLYRDLAAFKEKTGGITSAADPVAGRYSPSEPF